MIDYRLNIFPSFFHWTLTSAFSICLSAWLPTCFELECLRSAVPCQYWNPFPSSWAVLTVWMSFFRLVSLCILFSELQWRGVVAGNDSSGWTWDNSSGNPVMLHVVTMISQGKLFYIQQLSRQLWVGDFVILWEILIFQALAQATSTFEFQKDWS